MDVAFVGATLVAMLYALPAILLRAQVRFHKGRHLPL